jgi:glycosyltransferase involved in cell wall biosynthesis
MIVKNEEAVLARCLESVKNVVDEIVIVDTGSSDLTKAIAKTFTDNIYDFEWIDDFSATRNFAFSKATQDYTMWLDADDIMEVSEADKLRELKNNCDGSVDVYMLKYNITFDEKDNPTFSYYRERIVKTDKKFRWIDPVHEVILVGGKKEYADIAISHRSNKKISSDRNLKIYEKFIASGKALSARQKFYYSRELYYNNRIDEAIESFNEYLDKYDGWVENKIEATINLSRCYTIKNNITKSLQSLFSSFAFDHPRAEALCEIGYKFMQNKNYLLAIRWFEEALKCEPNISSGAFVRTDCYKFIPYLELCVCYYHLNDLKKAKHYNNLAYKIKPYDASVNTNKEFFKHIFSKNNK